jgi:hypothetical protein
MWKHLLRAAIFVAVIVALSEDVWPTGPKWIRAAFIALFCISMIQFSVEAVRRYRSQLGG